MDENHCTEHAWGFVASSVIDPPKCISSCRERLIRSLAPKDETLQSVCKALSDNSQFGGGEKFHEIYCCDSQLCGVNNLNGVGQDPTINWLINACQDIGYHSITDPGPPSPRYVCSRSFLYGPDTSCEKQELTLTSRAAKEIATPSGFIAEGFNTVTTRQQMPSVSTTVHSSTTALPTASSIHNPPLVAAADASKGNGTDSDDTGKLSTGVKVTIALCAVVAIIVVIAIFAWYMRRRAQYRCKRRISHPTKPIGSLDLAESHMPLVSPNGSYVGPENAPLTPPPRLRERRFLLPKALSSQPRYNGRSQAWSGIPLSPISFQSPPRVHHKRGKPLGPYNSEGISSALYPTSPTGLSREGHHLGNSLSSILSGTSTIKASNASTDTAQDRYSGATLTEPQKPPRVYGTPPIVAAPASPGPPPNKALPHTPSDGRASPMRSPTLPPVVSPVRCSNFGATIRTPPHRAAQGYHDLREPTEGNSNQPRSSSSSGGSSLSPRRIRHVRSPLLNEVDLESIMRRP